MKSGKTRFAGPPLLSRLRRRFAPLRGTQRRCAALFFAPPGRYAPCALRAQPFWKHEKNADISWLFGGGGNFVIPDSVLPSTLCVLPRLVDGRARCGRPGRTHQGRPLAQFEDTSHAPL